MKELTIEDDVYIERKCTVEVAGRISSGCLIADNIDIVGRRDHDPGFSGDMFFAPRADQEPRLRSEVEIVRAHGLGSAPSSSGRSK